jgi:DNA-binding IclR family transcriptional regulator
MKRISEPAQAGVAPSMATGGRLRQIPRAAQPSVADAATQSPATVKSAARVISILEQFDDVRRPMRVGEVAARLDYPQSSTSYLLRNLVEIGYLDCDPVARTYMPTPRVALLGSWISAHSVMDGPLIRLAQAVCAATGRTVTLAVRNGIYARYIHVREGAGDPPLHVPIGTCRLLVWSASGFALLTEETENHVWSLVQRTNGEARPHDAALSVPAVLAHVRRCREQGHFFSDEMVTPGAGHIAMRLPPRLTDGRAIVFGVAGCSPALRRDEAAVVAIMRKAIDALDEEEP